MIEIKTLSGELIELDNDEVTIELNNSLFNDGSKFAGSLSYPIDVSFSKRNKRLLRYAHAVETGIKSTSQEVYAKIQGKNFRKCALNVNIGDGSFDCNLEIDLGALNSFISNSKLAQVKFDTYQIGPAPATIQSQMWAAANNSDWRVTPYTFFPVRNPGFTGELISIPNLTPEYSGDPNNPIAAKEPYAVKGELVNSMYIDAGTLKFNVQTPADSKGRYHITPFFYLPYILTKISQHLGFTAKGDFLTHPDVAQMVLYNVNSTFVTRYDTLGYLTAERQGIFISAADHVPDITISEFFKTLNAYFGIRITPDIARGELTFSWKKSVFTDPVYKDWSSKLIRIRKQEFEASNGFTLKAEVDKLDSDTETASESVVIGKGQEPIDIKAGALRVAVETMLDTDHQWRIPTDNRSGNIVDPLFNELQNFKPFGNFNTFPIRFIIYQGIYNFGLNPTAYPMASESGSELSLSLKSLYEFSLKPWFSRTYGGKHITASFRLSAVDLCDFKDEDIILFKGENGTTVQALCERLTFTTKGAHHVAAEADLLILDSSYIIEDLGTGIFVRVTESNEQSTSFNDGFPSNPPRPATIPISGKTVTVDILIELFSDRACTLPLNAPNILVYLSVKKEESWRNLYYEKPAGGPIYTKTHEESSSHESTEYRKFRCTTNSLILLGQTKSDTKRFLVTTSDVNKYAYVDVIRSMHFQIQPNTNYNVAE